MGIRSAQITQIIPNSQRQRHARPEVERGDMQVPEGLYRIESLNPNSLYHLALRVNYPNQFDKSKGKAEKRNDLGCDIMIHGKNCSIGCLAMGDEAVEELFVLAGETGIENITVILSPVDFRTRGLPRNMPRIPHGQRNSTIQSSWN